jgi:hypothetical protein
LKKSAPLRFRRFSRVLCHNDLVCCPAINLRKSRGIFRHARSAIMLISGLSTGWGNAAGDENAQLQM